VPHVVGQGVCCDDTQVDCCTTHVPESADQLLEGAGSVLGDDAVYKYGEDKEVVNESVVG
jgi:hypothetical protein